MTKIRDSLDSNMSRDPLLLKHHVESIRESAYLNDKFQPSSVIIFSLANAMMGPTLILLPLSVVTVGLLTSTVVAVIICLISYRTCQLTHLHTKPFEFEFISSINRILGKPWEVLYFTFSLIILWMAGIIYFLALCDVIYSCLQLTFNIDLPAEDNKTFNAFSYQYIGIILMALIGWLFFLPKLGRILDLTEKGIYSIGVETIFLLYLGIKALANGDVTFTFHSTSDTPDKLGFVTSESMSDTIGVYAMAFTIHNVAVPVLKKNRDQSKNTRDVGVAYLITLLFYVVTGVFGAIGLYTDLSKKPNTVLTNDLYTGPNSNEFTTIFVIITQLMTAFQLVTVLPVLNNVIRTQLFIMIWGEDGIVPKFALPIFNAVFIITFLFVQIMNISPNSVMSYAGAFVGFIIIYLVPITIHLKAIRSRQIIDRMERTSLSQDGRNSAKYKENIADFVLKKQSINYPLEYGLHGAIMAVGVYIFISQLISVFA